MVIFGTATAGRFTETGMEAVCPPRVTVTLPLQFCAVVGTPVAASPIVIVVPETLVVTHAGIPEGRVSVTVPVAVPPTVAVRDEPVPLLALIAAGVVTVTVGVGVPPPPGSVRVGAVHGVRLTPRIIASTMGRCCVNQVLFCLL
jgi:hypothetical protein